MRSFLLCNEAIDTNQYDDYIAGMLELANIEFNDEEKTYVHISNFYNDNYIQIVETLGSKENDIIMFLRTLKSTPDNAINDEEIDIQFPSNCNGFLGFDFTGIADISDIRKIHNKENHELFSKYCLRKKSFESIDEFWKNKDDYFEHLLIADKVKSQLVHLATTDERFKLIFDKLETLNDFTGQWKEGPFKTDQLPLDNSPDTVTRVKNTLKYRTIQCTDGNNRVFTHHIKWNFAGEVFRMYFFPDSNLYKVHVGYIGDKAGIGFK